MDGARGQQDAEDRDLSIGPVDNTPGGSTLLTRSTGGSKNLNRSDPIQPNLSPYLPCAAFSRGPATQRNYPLQKNLHLSC